MTDNQIWDIHVRRSGRRRRRSPAPTAQHQENRMPKAKSAVAAIEKHQRLDRKLFKVCAAQDRGLANQRDVDRAGDAAERAAWKMARAMPTTVAGAAALA